ncbi:MAG TPA: V-type ATPase subunit [Candidatus Hydrogenedentes bacterium]|nr:V-type ATPase subunit [Candidatus Hydrogenedentota bacterium]
MNALTKDRHEWGFACGRVSVLEGRLMPQEFFLSLAAVERSEEIFHRLQDTALREWAGSGAASWEDWSGIIEDYLNHQVQSLRQDCPNPSLADMFAMNNDYLNLAHTVRDPGHYPFPPSLFPIDRLNEVAGGQTNLLPNAVRATMAELTAGMERDQTLGQDIALDGAYLRHYRALGAGLDAPMLTDWVDERVLGRAVTAFWRAARNNYPMKLYQQYFFPLGAYDGPLSDLLTSGDPQTWSEIIPGPLGDLMREAQQEAEEDQINYFEHKCADYLTGLARRCKMQTAGPERVAAYFWGLSVEAFNLRLVVSGCLNGVDSALLKSRVRATYV